jgi:putative transposase
MVAAFPPGRGSATLRTGRYSAAGQVYLITFTTHERRRLFVPFWRAADAARALHAEATASGSNLLAWVLMPDHCHLLTSLGDKEGLSRWVGRTKAAMARSIHRCEPDLGRVWARGFHDRALRNEESVPDAARYILYNPVRAGLVTRVGQYSFWGASWL